jgi:hypothetical protein
VFFTFAFLFTASPSYEGGEKRTTAKNKAEYMALLLKQL